jgi:putative ABC transport system substrate-binding protein
MRRRTVLLGLGVSTVSPVGYAQQASVPVIGWLNPRSESTDVQLVAAMRRGLGEVGFMEGQNIAIEYRWADGNYNRLSDFASELVRRRVTVIVTGSPPGIIAAKGATTTIPIVFTSGGDPVGAGFVSSLKRPGGNVTGVYILATELEAKRLEVLSELVPKGTGVAILANPSYRETETQLKAVQKAAQALALPLNVLNATSDLEIAAAFGTMTEQKTAALLVLTDPFFNSRHDLIVSRAAKNGIPAVYPLPEYAKAGGLMSYGTSIADAYYQCGIYAGRILKGEQPGDLPVIQSTKVELIINLKTAKALGITFPRVLLGRADEVLE